MPQQNDVAKRKNHTIGEAEWIMLEEKHMLKSYWVDSISTIVYLVNQTPIGGSTSDST